MYVHHFVHTFERRETLAAASRSTAELVATPFFLPNLIFFSL
jgi:hypothetical protein